MSWDYRETRGNSLYLLRIPSYLFGQVFLWRYSFASLIKLTVISIITIPIGKAAIIDTDCRLYMEFSAKISAIGNKINSIDQKVLTFLSGSASIGSFLYEYAATTMVIESNVVE